MLGAVGIDKYRGHLLAAVPYTDLLHWGSHGLKLDLTFTPVDPRSHTPDPPEIDFGWNGFLARSDSTLLNAPGDTRKSFLQLEHPRVSPGLSLIVLPCIMSLYLTKRRDTAMPRRVRPKQCACGCGEITKGGNFIPGHDSKLQSAIVEKVGGIIELRRIVEKALRCKIQPRWE
ncbi:MAG: hypothetical protein WD078_15740 [Woeseia sp.]